MANFLTFTTYQVQKHLQVGANLMIISLELKKQIFQEGKLKAGDKNAIKEFSEKCFVSEKLVADYIEHLTDFEGEKISGEQIMTGNMQKESNKNTMTLTGKISIT